MGKEKGPRIIQQAIESKDIAHERETKLGQLHKKVQRMLEDARYGVTFEFETEGLEFQIAIIPADIHGDGAVIEFSSDDLSRHLYMPTRYPDSLSESYVEDGKFERQNQDPDQIAVRQIDDFMELMDFVNKNRRSARIIERD